MLGPLEVVVAGHEVPLGGAKQRLVFATLAASPNTVVSADRLVRRGVGRRAAAERARHAAEVRLPAARRTRPGGSTGPSRRASCRPGRAATCSSLAPGDLDADRFTDLVDAAHRHAASGDAATAMTLLTSALGLWRGTPAWVEFDDRGMFRAEIARLEGLRMAAIEDRIEVGLALGHHRELIGELEATTESFPLRERPRAQLMLALYRSGRQVEALRSYQAFRTYLNDELGLEPSEALQQLEQDIVLLQAAPRPRRRRPLLVDPSSAGTGRATVALPPALQPGPGIFVGRAAELDWLAVLWARALAGRAERRTHLGAIGDRQDPARRGAGLPVRTPTERTSPMYRAGLRTRRGLSVLARSDG